MLPTSPCSPRTTQPGHAHSQLRPSLGLCHPLSPVSPRSEQISTWLAPCRKLGLLKHHLPAASLGLPICKWRVASTPSSGIRQPRPSCGSVLAVVRPCSAPSVLGEPHALRLSGLAEQCSLHTQGFRQGPGLCSKAVGEGPDPGLPMLSSKGVSLRFLLHHCVIKAVETLGWSASRPQGRACLPRQDPSS